MRLRPVEFRRHRPGRAAAGWRDIDTAAATFSNDVGDPLSVGRKAGRRPARRKQPLFAAQCRHHIDAAVHAAGLKGDLAAVRRKGWVDVIGSVARQPDWSAVRDVLNPDIQIALAAPIGRVREQLSIE